MTMSISRAAVAAFAGVALGGCGEDPTRPTLPGPPPIGSLPDAAQVLVVNTLSETISQLDLDSGTFTVQAAVTGTWTNRITTASDGRILLVTDSGSNEVALLDAGTLQRVGAIDLGPGSNPWLARGIDGSRGVASNWLKGELRLLDLVRGEATTAVPTTPGPEGFVVLGEAVFVACTNYLGAEGSYGEGRLDVVDLVTARVVASIPVGTNPQDVALGPDGMLHVVCTGDHSPASTGKVSVVDPALRAVAATVSLEGAPGRLAAAPDGAMWVVGYSGGIQRYDPFTRSILPGPADPDLQSLGFSAIAADAAGGRVYVTAFDDDLLIAVDATSGAVAGAWIAGDGPVDVLVSRP